VKRRGFVLIVVVYALVLLAATIAGGFFASLQELRAGRNAAATLRVRLAASSAIAAAIGGWDPRAANALAIGGSLPLTVPVTPGIVTQLIARRLSDRLFLLRAAAVDSSGEAQSLQTIARLDALDLAPAAAVRARIVDPVLISSFVGADQAPAGWNCPPAGDTIAALITQPGASDSVFFRFGAKDWAAVTSWATSISSGGDSLPVTYAPGDLAIAGSRVLGVVIVEGDLTLTAGAQILGLVLVHGKLNFGVGGGVISGQVIASQVIAIQGYRPSQPSVAFSSCSVWMASLARALPQGLHEMPLEEVF
jgi:hypothetical protein